MKFSIISIFYFITFTAVNFLKFWTKTLLITFLTHERIQSNLWIFTSDYFAKNSKNCKVKIIIIFKKNNLLTNFWRHHLFRPLENPITKRKKSQITEVTIRYKKNFNFTILGLVSSQSTRLINFNGLENLRCESFFFILSLFFCIFLRFIKKP